MHTHYPLATVTTFFLSSGDVPSRAVHYPPSSQVWSPAAGCGANNTGNALYHKVQTEQDHRTIPCLYLCTVSGLCIHTRACMPAGGLLLVQCTHKDSLLLVHTHKHTSTECTGTAYYSLVQTHLHWRMLVNHMWFNLHDTYHEVVIMNLIQLITKQL